MQNSIANRAMVRRPTSASASMVPNQPGGFMTSFPYHSTVLFRSQAVLVGGVPTYPFPLGVERKAFGYASGQEWTTAGADTAIDGRATDAETNLTKPNETISGESLEISGIAVQVLPAVTDGTRFPSPRALAMIATNVALELSVNGGSNSYKLGTVGMIPGAGGLLGSGEDLLNIGPQSFNFFQNGWQVRSNFYRLPEGLIWRPSGEADSQLQVIFRTTRAFQLYYGGDFDHQVVPEGDYPAFLACALKVHLIGRQTSQRSAIR